MDVYCPSIRHADWHHLDPDIQPGAERLEDDAECELEVIDLYTRRRPLFRFAEEPVDAWSLEAERGLERSKVRRLLLSCILASSLCLVSLALGLGDVIGLFKVLHPLFWFPIAAGACGVGGSNFIYLRRLWPT
jgi:hypothetical protein